MRQSALKWKFYRILQYLGAWPIYFALVYGVSFWLFLSALWKRYAARKNIACATLAFLTAFAFFWFPTWAVIKGRATDERIKQNEIEIQRIRDILEEEQRRKEELQRKLFTYCEGTRNPPVCREIADAGIVAEDVTGIVGLAKFAIALGKSEQNYTCPARNCYGLGAVNRWTYNRYNSYLEATIDLGKILRKRGYTSISPQDIPAISLWYKGVPPYSAWVALIQSVMREVS